MNSFNNSRGPILVNQSPLDDLARNQSSIFYYKLPLPLNNRSTLLQLDPFSGAGLHCGVGSTSSEPIQILRWLNGAIKN